MSLYIKRTYIKLTIVFFLSVICVLNLMNYCVVERSIPSQLYQKKVQTPNSCSCADNHGNKYNFCYANPNNSTMIGQRFDCKHVETVKEMGLLDMNYIDLSRQEMPEPQFVTALSSNHVQEGRRQLKNLHFLWPNKTIVVFDMGLKKYRKEYESDPLVDLRSFTFDKYPAYVEKLEEYRWKPIIIANMLKEFGAIFYIDSSIMFHDSDLSPVYNLIGCKNKNSRAAEMVSHPKYLKNNDIGAMLKTCNKSSYLFHGDSGHSVFAATHPGIYDFLPISPDVAKSALMHDAGVVTVVKTKEAVENIVKWYVFCALEENCMAPPGAHLYCNFESNDRFNTFANCHRYDQSVVNVLAANLFNADVNLYASRISGYLSVDR